MVSKKKQKGLDREITKDLVKKWLDLPLKADFDFFDSQFSPPNEPTQLSIDVSKLFMLKPLH